VEAEEVIGVKVGWIKPQGVSNKSMMKTSMSIVEEVAIQSLMSSPKSNNLSLQEAYRLN
jgi:hypothetical protein